MPRKLQPAAPKTQFDAEMQRSAAEFVAAARKHADDYEAWIKRERDRKRKKKGK